MPQRAGRGRPAVWCSQRCRRAAYEARRAAREGAKGVELVRLEVAPPRPPDEAVKEVLASPAACRAVLRGLREVAKTGDLRQDPRWDGVLVTLSGVLDANARSVRRF